jgi:hypothetical protein
MRELDRTWWKQLGVTLGWIGVAVLLGILMHVFLSPAHARWREEYAQLSPQERQWWRDQKNPQTHVPCCSTADGTYAQEDIRNGVYWTRFKYEVTRTGQDETTRKEELDSGWMEVPKEVILDTTPNMHGAPAVWWGVNYPGQGGAPVPFIRCFAPGAKG